MTRLGCPICGYDYSDWSLIGQEAHMVVDHSLWQRLRARWRFRLPLRALLAVRKYGPGGAP